jgi:hypothetical protein
MPRKMEWNEDQIDMMKILMSDGLSTSRIADEMVKKFKIHCTRNSIIGKIHRLGLATRKQPIKSKPRPAGIPKQIRRLALATSRPLPPRLIAIETVAQHPVAMAMIETKLCHWIINDCQQSPAIMCGDPISPGSSYCQYHRGIGTVAPRARLARSRSY